MISSTAKRLVPIPRSRLGNGKKSKRITREKLLGGLGGLDRVNPNPRGGTE